MTLRIDQAAVEATTRELFDHHNVVEEAAARPRPVDTGETTGLTADAVADVVRRAREAAAGLAALGAGLEVAVAEAWTADDSASLVLGAVGEAVVS